MSIYSPRMQLLSLIALQGPKPARRYGDAVLASGAIASGAIAGAEFANGEVAGAVDRGASQTAAASRGAWRRALQSWLLVLGFGTVIGAAAWAESAADLAAECGDLPAERSDLPNCAIEPPVTATSHRPLGESASTLADMQAAAR